MSLIDQKSLNTAEAREVTLPSWQHKLQEMLNNSPTITEPNAIETHSFLKQNELALAAGGNNADNLIAHTSGNSARERNQSFARDAKLALQNYGRAAAEISQDVSELTLADNLLSIAQNGLLMINHREATLEEKMVIEENSHACSIGVTQAELDIKEFLAGRTTEVPEILQKMAEDRGITNPSMEDYQNMVQAELPAHIASRMMIADGIKLDGQQPSSPTLSSNFSDATADGPMSAPAADLTARSLLPPQTSLPQSTPMPG